MVWNNFSVLLTISERSWVWALNYKKGKDQPGKKTTGIHKNNPRNKPRKHALKIKVTIPAHVVLFSVIHTFFQTLKKKKFPLDRKRKYVHLIVCFSLLQTHLPCPALQLH